MKQPNDTFAQRGRRLASELQRRRDWAGGDPSRMAAVADALVELTAHRLSGHAWAEAASGVQEAVTLSAKVLARNGPVGPYTPRADAARSVTSLVQLALIQSTAGLHAQAEQAVAAALGLREQLRRLDLDGELTPQTVAWALLVWARAGLAGGDVRAANARADAAVAVGADDGEFIAMDVDRVASEARWAAGSAEPAVEYALRAVERYDGLASDLLERPAQLPAAMLERLSEPLFGLYSEAADRVLAIGADGLALTLRRRLVELLGAVGVRRPEAQRLLAVALSDLSDDLRGLGRAAEADDVAELAASVTGDSDDEALPRRERPRLGEPTSWDALPPAEAFGVQGEAGEEPSGRLAALRGPAEAAEATRRADAEAELAARARQAATDAARRAEDAELHRAEQRRLAVERAERERREAADAAERDRVERQRKRAERIAEHERQAERERAEAEAALRARISDETDQERAEREELERLAAELATLDAEPAQPPAAEPDPSLVEPVETPADPPRSPVERVDIPADPPPSPVERVETPADPPRSPVERVDIPADPPRSPVERVDTPGPSLVELVETPNDPVTPEPEDEHVQPTAEQDTLEQARSEVEQAAAAGKRREVRDASEALVEELQARYDTDPAAYLDELLAALDQLAAARWQAGDWWGSRGPAKRAKALRRQHRR